MRLLAFDLETQYTADEVGGWGNIPKMRMSVGVTYDPDADLYAVYLEEDVGALIDALREAGLVVGYNLYRFDYQVLQPYTEHRMRNLATLDMLRVLKNHLGWRPRLDDLAAATLGERKSGNGLDAVRWFREGNLDQVIEYCKRDVEVTWKVYEFGHKNGYVQVLDRRRRPKKVLVQW